MNKEIFLHPKYTFDNFVVGECNEQAFSQAAAITTTRQEPTKPLMIHGSMGIGKTHLLHAIIHNLLKNGPEKCIVYATGETFVNDVYETLESSKNNENAYLDFENKYKKADVLVIDDVEPIFKQNLTRKIYLEVLWELRENNKRVIMSSTKFPESVANHRKWKLYVRESQCVEVREPDFKTRCTILQKKIKMDGLEKYDVSTEAIQFLAKKIRGNVRILEGVLNKTVAMYRLQRAQRFDLTFVKQCYKEIERYI